MNNIYCATGHRPQYLGGFDANIFIRLKATAIEYIKSLNIPPDLIWCGGALGWDMAIGLACIDLRLPYALALPCTNQDKKWSNYYKARYKFLKENAKEIWYATSHDYTGPECMFIRDRYMVDQCTVGAIALWNPSKKSGGTYETVQFAQQQRKAVFNAWEYWIKEEQPQSMM
jgi:uncharacterized phage-like protein YoqJ